MGNLLFKSLFLLVFCSILPAYAQIGTTPANDPSTTVFSATEQAQQTTVEDTSTQAEPAPQELDKTEFQKLLDEKIKDWLESLTDTEINALTDEQIQTKIDEFIEEIIKELEAEDENATFSDEDLDDIKTTITETVEDEVKAQKKAAEQRAEEAAKQLIKDLGLEDEFDDKSAEEQAALLGALAGALLAGNNDDLKDKLEELNKEETDKISDEELKNRLEAANRNVKLQDDYDKAYQDAINRGLVPEQAREYAAQQALDNQGIRGGQQTYQDLRNGQGMFKNVSPIGDFGTPQPLSPEDQELCGLLSKVTDLNHMMEASGSSNIRKVHTQKYGGITGPYGTAWNDARIYLNQANLPFRVSKSSYQGDTSCNNWIAHTYASLMYTRDVWNNCATQKWRNWAKNSKGLGYSYTDSSVMRVGYHSGPGIDKGETGKGPGKGCINKLRHVPNQLVGGETRMDSDTGTSALNSHRNVAKNRGSSNYTGQILQVLDQPVGDNSSKAGQAMLSLTKMSAQQVLECAKRHVYELSPLATKYAQCGGTSGAGPR